MFLTAALIAQDSGIPVTVQLETFVTQLLSPAGIASVVVAVSIGLVLVATRQVLPALIVAGAFTTTFQANHRLTSNMLLGPLQSFRFFSKPLAFVLLVAAVAFSFGAARGDRRTLGGFASAGLAAFQCYFLIQFALFTDDGLIKGGFGVLTVFLTWWVFSVALGRQFTDCKSATHALEGFAYVGAAFVAVNLVQIVVSLGGALEGGRLAGIGGNAQMMGCICVMLLILNAFLAFSPDTTRRARILATFSAGFLGVLMLATGSRTAMLSTAVAALIMFRAQVGRIVLVTALVTVATFAVSIFFTDVTAAAAERVLSTNDTRSEGWIRDLEGFYRSPIFGQLPFLERGEGASGIESVLIRTLSSMGLVGLMVLGPFVIAVGASCIKAVGLMRASAAHSDLCGLLLASSVALLIFNLLDGYAFGLMTFPVVSMYVVASLGSFLSEEADRLSNSEVGEWATA